MDFYKLSVLFLIMTGSAPKKIERGILSSNGETGKCLLVLFI